MGLQQTKKILHSKGNHQQNINITHRTGEHTGGQQTYEMMLNITNHQRNAN